MLNNSRKLSVYDLGMSFIIGFIFVGLIQGFFNILLIVFFKTYNSLIFHVTIVPVRISLPDYTGPEIGILRTILFAVVGNFYLFTIVIVLFIWYQKKSKIKQKNIVRVCRYLFCIFYLISAIYNAYYVAHTLYLQTLPWFYVVVTFSLLTYYFILPWAVFKYQAWAIERSQKNTQKNE